MNKKESLITFNNSCYSLMGHAETKFGILCAINVGIIAAVIGVYGSNNFFSNSFSDWRFWCITSYFLVVILSCIVSLIICCILLSPKFVKPNVDNSNCFYFGDVKNFDTNEYLKKLEDENKNLEDLAKENIILSNFIIRKYKFFKIALVFFFYSLFLYTPFLFLGIKKLFKKIFKH